MARRLVHPIVARSFAALGLLAALSYAPPAAAQQQPPPWCLPGTTVCVQGTGQGGGGAGGTLGGSASGQVGPNGAQGQAQGNAQGNANAQGQAQGNTWVRPPPPREDDEPSVQRRRRVRTGPPLALGASPCLIARIGIWSGYRGGACFGFGLRDYSGVGFELDLAVLWGGTIPTLDLLLRPVLVIPLAGTTPYFDQLSLRIGATMVGASIPTGGERSYMRFGGSVGLGYDIALSDSVAWRVLETSFYGEVQVRGRRSAYMDRLDDTWDVGLMLSTAFLFH